MQHPQIVPASGQALPEAFEISFTLALDAAAEQEFVNIGSTVVLSLRLAGTFPDLQKWDGVLPNYLNFPLPDGRSTH